MLYGSWTIYRVERGPRQLQQAEEAPSAFAAKSPLLVSGIGSILAALAERWQHAQEHEEKTQGVLLRVKIGADEALLLAPPDQLTYWPEE
jgi:hypothetical protein